MIHRLLTLIPGQSREYPGQEFARDVCLLDQSRLARTRKGYDISFPASTGTQSLQNTLRVITAEGLPGDDIILTISRRGSGRKAMYPWSAGYKLEVMSSPQLTNIRVFAARSS
ncbi:MAG TPA: hypothetical protein DD435_10260 [Cyanobacteria bacterium UBA8530]|nr:hypothetical protein [Cyanobacteria bacterium UBA8530]